MKGFLSEYVARAFQASTSPESKQAEPHSPFVAQRITDVLVGKIKRQLPQNTRFAQAFYFLC